MGFIKRKAAAALVEGLNGKAQQTLAIEGARLTITNSGPNNPEGASECRFVCVCISRFIFSLFFRLFSLLRPYVSLILSVPISLFRSLSR